METFVQDKLESLHKAIVQGEEINHLLSSDVINEWSADGKAALHLAIDGGHLNLMQTLIDRGAQVTKKSRDKDMNVIHWAVNNHQDEKIMEFLMRKEECIKMINEKDQNGDIPLLLGLRRRTMKGPEKGDALKWMLENDGSVPGGRPEHMAYSLDYDSINNKGESALNLAAAVDDQEMLRKIVEKVSEETFDKARNDGVDDQQQEVESKPAGNTPRKTKKKLKSPLIISANKDIWRNVEILLNANCKCYKPDDLDCVIEIALEKHEDESFVTFLDHPVIAEFRRSKECSKNSSIHTPVKKENQRDLIKLPVKNEIDNSTEMQNESQNEMSSLQTVINIDNNLDPNKQDKQGTTPLQRSVLDNNVTDTRYWLRQGGDPKLSVHGNKPLLYHAVKSGNEKIVKLLLQFDGYVKDWVDIYEGKSMMHYAIESKELKILELLLKFEVCHLDLQDNEEKSVLQYAVEKLDPEIVKLLLQSGGCNREMENDVLIEAMKLFSENQSERKADAMSIIKLLLQFDVCSLDAKDQDERTALHHAVEIGDLDLVGLLLKFDDCSLHASKDKDGKTALHHAVELGDTDLVDLLLKFDDSSLHAKDKDGKTALHYAVKSKSKGIIELLLRLGASDEDLLLKNAITSGHQDIVKLFLQFGSYEKHWADNAGNLMIYRAVESEKSEIVKLLLKFEVCHLDLSGNKEKSVLHCAVEKLNPKIVKLLIQSGGCNLGMKNDVLIRAVKLFSENQSRRRADAMSIIKLLLQFDVCSLDTKDKDERTALNHAVELGDENLVDLLLTFGASDEGLLHMIAFEGQISLYEKYNNKGTLERRYALGKYYKMKIIKGNKYFNEPCTFLEVACLQAQQQFLENVIEMILQTVPQNSIESVENWRAEVKEDCKNVFEEMITQLKQKRNRWFDEKVETITERVTDNKNVINDIQNLLLKQHSINADFMQEVNGKLDKLQENFGKTAKTATDFVRAMQSTQDGKFATNVKQVIHHKMFLQISRHVGNLPKVGGICYWEKLIKFLFSSFAEEMVNFILKAIPEENKTESECTLQGLVYWKYLVCFGHVEDKELQDLQRSLEKSKIKMNESPKEIIDREIKTWSDTGEIVDITREDLNNLACKIGNEWYNLGMRLGFDSSDLDQFNNDCPSNAQQRNCKMLQQWKNRESGFSRHAVLFLAKKLEECNRVDLAKEIKSVALIDALDKSETSHTTSSTICTLI